MAEREQTEKLVEAMSKFHKLKPFTISKEIPQGELFLLCSIYNMLHEEEESNYPGIKISVLSDRTGMSMPTVSQVLNALEDKELIERKTDKRDRRAVYVSVTPKGEKMSEETRCAIKKRLGLIVERLGKENTETLVSLLDRLYVIVKEAEQ